MVLSSTYIGLQSHRISQSEISTHRAINICDVVNINALQHARASDHQNVTRQCVRLLLDYGDIWIYPNE